ncbi:hypothetical protein NX722_05095 [Endozoicomonas gorgoniicola]|uniref:Uncharacterized protein n=1 Tax=Endozoicomonas gorgoniicola TaxID=1234144 RepID=A0ABT3MRR0_9GAMM|nr:hypothetical protein [Endozoicomonas gorgoniicola]MCW7552027.1 hypothetical protein [Endozoicomonas gorgoniicola]
MTSEIIPDAVFVFLNKASKTHSPAMLDVLNIGNQLQAWFLGLEIF